MIKWLWLFCMMICLPLRSGSLGECEVHLEELRREYNENLFNKYIFQKKGFIHKVIDLKTFRDLRKRWVNRLVSLNGNSFQYIYLNKDLSFLADTFQGVSYKGVELVPDVKNRFKAEAPDRFEEYKESSDRIDKLIQRYESLEIDRDEIFERVINLRFQINQLENLPSDITFPYELKYIAYSSLDDSKKIGTETLDSQEDIRVRLRNFKEDLKEREVGTGEHTLEGREILQYKMKRQLEIYLEYLKDVIENNSQFKGLETHLNTVENLLDNDSLKVNEIVKNYMNRHELYEEIKYYFQQKVKTPDDVLVKMKFHTFGTYSKTNKYLPRLKVVGRTSFRKFALKHWKKGLALFGAVSTGVFNVQKWYYKYELYVHETERSIQRCLKNHLDRNSMNSNYKFSEKDYKKCKNIVIKTKLSNSEYSKYSGRESFDFKEYISPNGAEPRDEDANIVSVLKSIEKVEKAWEYTMKIQEETKAAWEQKAKEFAAQSY